MVGVARCGGDCIVERRLSRTSGKTRYWVIAAVSLIVLLCGGVFAMFTPRHVTTSLMSPDQHLRAVLLDARLHGLDRNFAVCIEETGGDSRRIFGSPDEAPSGIGSERFIWSKDSKGLLLVGSRFYARKGVQLASGEHLYLLYDRPSGKVWCNSDMIGPPFGPDELKGYDFGEDLTLKPVTEEAK